MVKKAVAKVAPSLGDPHHDVPAFTAPADRAILSASGSGYGRAPTSTRKPFGLAPSARTTAALIAVVNATRMAGIAVSLRLRRAVGIGAFIGCVVFLAGAHSAVAAPVLDANCPESTPSGNTANPRLAQTFTVQNAGSIVGAQARINPFGGTSDYVFSIHQVDGTGTPTNTELASGVVPLTSVGTGSEPVTATFSTPLPVNPGETYALVIRRVTATEEATALINFNDTCPASARYSSPTATGAFFPVDGDMVFAIFVEPSGPQLDPGPQPGPKADGTLMIDANKGKVEKGRKVTLTGQLDVAANESCEQNRPIQIQRRLKSEDDSKFSTFQTVNTDAAGNFTLKTKVKKTYFYRAVVSETEACDDEVSNSQKVRVQKKKAAQEA
jgi:hypothetical protein